MRESDSFPRCGRHLRPSALAWLGACALMAVTTVHGADFGSDTPSVKDIISNLQEDQGSAVEGVRTRALRPGAAAQATAVDAVAEPPPAAAAPAISMQIQFEFGSDRIAPASAQAMDNLALALASPELEGRQFTVVGHTDGVGSAEYNLRLSQRRAASVKAYLVRGGVAATRLKTEGKGYTELLDPGNPRAASNRRVEIIAGG
ncbi:OmpA family protein [Corticibacter populi]|nr:OmpA family protein [Corticibacter populi]RZS33268.1 outer membrane protein OmpA-like peptidoglycan-associated protein [Corticibacter populi]